MPLVAGAFFVAAQIAGEGVAVAGGPSCGRSHAS
jgi:hypothetical protein